MPVLVPTAPMSIGVELIWEERLGQQLLIYEGIARLLKILPNSANGAVIHDWLLGTRK
jgi:hypothetical protein